MSSILFVSQLPLPQLADLPSERRASLLGLACIGHSSEPWLNELPVQTIAVPLLGDAPPAIGEFWTSAGACRSGMADGIRFRVNDNVLFGVVEADDADYPAQAGASPVQSAAEDAFRRIFALLDKEGYAHLWRTWNYLPEINAVRDGLERYRQFNIGRHDAFVASGRLARAEVPAACVLGTRTGPLTIAFIAGRQAPIPIENPRQVSAYRYPREYGPRSPTFARAVLARPPGQELLFVSGTASIVGHRTVHVDDIVGQTGETIANISAVLAEANRQALSAPFTLADLHYRAYLRRAEDFAEVAAVLAASLGPDARIITVQADICRADLLVEIEAIASHSMGSC